MSIPAYFTSGEAPVLHASTKTGSTRVQLEYLNEGGANFVFRILPAETNGSLPSDLERQLLRLRKDLPHVQSAKDQLSALEKHFKPLFPADCLIRHTVIELDSDLLTAINAALRKFDRPANRLQDFVPEEDGHGLLVTDMTAGPDDLLLQLKPKWLSQSPTAPSDAKRCRTCALRAQRISRKKQTATDAQEHCPLELIAPDEAHRRQAAQRVTVNQELQKWLVEDAHPLLQTLRDNQQKLDRKGVRNATSEEDVMDVCKAMTLRDCTLFVKLSGGSIEARLADLDLKQMNKLFQWRKVEQDLINEGWYTNSERRPGWKQETVCLLSSHESKRSTLT